MQPTQNLDGQDGPPSDLNLITLEFSTPPRKRAAGDPFLAIPGADTDPNVSSVEPPHPSILREPAQKFRVYYTVTKGWEVGIYTLWAIAESRLTGIVGGSAVKMSKNWLSAYHYYSTSYYAGVVKIVPRKSITPIANHPFSSPATGSPSHPIYIASAQVTPVSGTPIHPYIIPSTPGSPSPVPAFRQTTTDSEASSIPASFVLSQGSPSPAFRPRQFLHAPAPVVQPTPAATSGFSQLSFAVGPIPANSCVSISASLDFVQPNIIATTPNTTPHRRVVNVVGSDSDDSDDIATLPSASTPASTTTHFRPRAGSYIHTNPSTPTNLASHQTSSLIVEVDEDEYICSDFDDPEFLEDLNVVLASHSSPVTK